MLRIDTPKLAAGGGRILCIGAHCDDIEIGCGGTILELTERYPDLHVTWIVLSSNEVREQEARLAADCLLQGVTDRRVEIERFRNAFFPSELEGLKHYFETLKDVEPDLIFTHARDDGHQDHRVVSELTWNTFRDHFILEYEIPKYDGDLGRPGFYVGVSEATAQRKVRCLIECFASQTSRHWFTEDLFLGLMRLRGVECAERYAEAFHSRKALL